MWAMWPDAGLPAIAAARLLTVPAVALAGALITLPIPRDARV
jgi:hypothetical protein